MGMLVKTMRSATSIAALVCAAGILGSTPAQAGCSQSGTVETCTGDVSGEHQFFNMPAILPVIKTVTANSITKGPRRISLVATGQAGASGASGVEQYSCTISGAQGSGTAAGCIIDNNASPPTCLSYNGSKGQKASCTLYATRAGGGGSGGPGKSVTISVVAPTDGSVKVGAHRSNIAILGYSGGANGGDGGNAKLAGNGGDGGNGVDGGTVRIDFTGVIADGNHGGILAQSVGGSGGDGGNKGPLGGTGGSGGEGGYGGTAAVTFNGGLITTSGIGNAGILAISQGGNGGNGGSGFGLFYSGGGAGNIAGQAGTAQVITLAGTVISTSGDYAHGIAAYSLGGGGGGGSGGFGLFYSGGGTGSTGGNGGTVTIDASSVITTTGNYAQGILAQSIGGGGGSAASVSGLVALGAGGGGGGQGGTVTVINASTATITTHGFGSNAIEAQSIGGGGGNGSNSVGLFSMGGDGSGTTTGGKVSVTNNGVLNTYSSLAAGILAQSIGGGGGNGGTSVGAFAFGGSGGSGADGNTVTVTNGGDIYTGLGTDAIGSPGILAQSVGGGGGNGGGSVSASPGVAVAFGGSGGMAGNGSTVKVLRDNADASLATAYDISTYGNASSAIIAQSIGGGGGNGGFAVAASASPYFSVALGVGGAGGAGGSGGTVEVDTKGSLETWGSSSSGILAQSLGGGGGNGGFSVAASVSFGASISVGLGGSGAAGGSASGVTVSSLSDITTAGTNSYGILAQSVGGGGGNGGFSVAASGGIVGVSVGVGGTGGTGGSASTVDVTNVGNISTSGASAVGIAAQSIGGGGGNGGFSVSVGIGTAGVGVGVGGSGGFGGTADWASIDNSGYVWTTGDNATGILAQSLGGGGGNGGFSAAGAIGLGGSAAVAVGGSGGGGQYADSAYIYADGGGTSIDLNTYGSGWTLVTEGANSAGIEAQSIGGGGGNGGFAGSLSLSGGYSGGLSLGGSGGAGSYASEALVQSGYGRSYANNIFTVGDNSAGIIAQSIGGGGGNGGFAVSLSGSAGGGGSAAVTLGGSGGNGGTAALAEVDSVGDITTLGNLSDAIIAQSIGGGGGNGGFSVAISATTTTLGGAVAIGGSGGSGNNGGAAVLDSSGTITTYGDQSNGLFAQSVGGGGGNGGFAGVGVLSTTGTGVAVGLGGSGSGGGSGSTVDLTNDGAVTTYGDQSSAIIAQSVGGGGGNGGSTVGISLSALGGASVAIGGSAGDGGNSDDVVVDSTGDLTTGVGSVAGTASNNAFGILAQSIGGGGGNGGFAGSLSAGGAVGIGVSVGGAGGAGGSSGTVDVTSTGDIATVFDNSGGILGQSIGGGGGSGGFSVSVATSATIEDIGAAAAVSVGGFGGTAGVSDDVTVTSTGTVYTQGFNSAAIAAQSIGGGGGNGGFSVAGSATLGQAGVDISFGGFGAGGGDAASASVYSYGTGYQVVPAADVITIETDGMQSDGILAQSLGGGGGNGGFSVGLTAAMDGGGIGVSVGGFGAGGGSSDTVVVSSYNNILTEGFQSNAIVAQSIGGGGGNGGFSAEVASGSDFGASVSVGGFALSGGGDAGIVSVDSHGLLTTAGFEANGILAQSIGGGGGNGGFSFSGSFTTGSAGLNASVGGFGSVGGDSAAVTVVSYSAAMNAIPASNVLTIKTFGAESNGILAQSIGGGGGNGGFSIGASLATNGAAIGVSVGGFGAGGGSSDDVVVTSYNNIVTQGFQSNAIEAQSLGGGGGNGGFALEATVGSDFAGSVSVGGFALSGGGDAGTVSADSFGILVTDGDSANGILAQSIGGGGGNGGFALSGAFTLNNGGLTASVGGFGSKGGLGADVTVNSNAGTTLADYNATIQTSGDSANGIEAQSIGGGGGNGGFSGGFTASMDSKATVSLSVGGFGAAGNSAGTVDVVSVDNILTEGDGSNAILAQSIGGGGGSGGFSFAGSLSVPDGNSFTLAASLGGFGGSGGDAAAVTVNSTGAISTSGLEADGVLAQSIGGGGGNGGISVAGSFNFASENNVPSITASVGGTGGAGGAAGDVVVTRHGITTTIDDQSYGILAQSIGGGGGNGGLSIAGSIGGKDAKQIAASVGGFGGAGSEAGDVTVTNKGAITTGSITMQQQQLAEQGTVFATVPVVTGYGSDGILAQSIGGGGGNGGFAFSGSIGPTGENTNVSVDLTVGGFGGSGGYAGDVGVTNNGLITTYGDNANGVSAQSIGGGGGNGGSAVTGIIAAGDPQAGGRAVNVAVSVGGTGGNGNVAGNVNVEQTGGVYTSGDGSNGILAQSIGGGGGNGGGANSLSLQLGTSCTFTIPLGLYDIKGCKAPKKASVNVQIDVGGFGGTGNDAGLATVFNHSSITTLGNAASGIVAQSIGGGGGNGGQAIVGLDGLFPGAEYVSIATSLITLPISTTGFAQGLGRVTVGGFGGAGGDGKRVYVSNEGAISTSGDASYGIEAQSIGGGGGNGGDAGSGITGALSVGGFSLASGSGGIVFVDNKHGADIVTSGLASDAIFAQSVGGGGGNGGAAGGLIALGGFGGASGNGGSVEVANAASLQTSGWFANGILAQSIGGGGGNGGGTGLSAIAIGGWAGVLGSSTGNGGGVVVRNTATILTTGWFANGIEAQSIGGGGGKGGGSTLAAAVTVGGKGGSGGNGDAVNISNSGTISTEGVFSYGVFAQSVGGSGGDGGGSNVSAINVGGFGGGSGNGGKVDITNTGTVHTWALGSDAIVAQSIGGGGGNAGGVDDTFLTGAMSIGVVVDVGGSGGSAGDGGVIDITNSGTVETDGDVAVAIRAQSIGGGGGSGGRSIGVTSIGGSGGAAGNGGDVTVTNNAGGTIWTKGKLSDGIYAQSVGGGGGIGGGAYSGSPIGYSTSVGGSGGGGGNGGSVLVDNFAEVTTDGLASVAIFAQSVGGGGGDGSVAGSYNAAVVPLYPAIGVSVGGSGGVGGGGGNVTVNNNTGGSITTNGTNSTAIFAQSVGGGGGIGGHAMTVSGAPFGSIGVTLGGSGGAGGNGGAVSVTNAGSIELNGKNSIGIMAQSVGGGGGITTDALGVAVIPVTIGGQTGANGTGGGVSVTNTGSITINGKNSIGIFAQSVGGGGGMVLPGGGVTSVALATGGTGDGGTVTIVNSAGSIIINGDNSIAMYMQSVGGGGGAVGLDADPPGQTGAFLFSGTSGGSGAALATTINQTGNLIATGLNSIALVGQSSATGGVGDITVNILNPTDDHSLIIGGLGQGAGVEILDGADNVLNNAGVIGATPVITDTVTGFSADDGTFLISGGNPVSGTDGYAVMASGNANTTIFNTGVIMGSVDLGTAGTNAFNNEADAYFDSGAVVILGSGTLTNAGILSPGGFQNVSVTDVTGNVVQTATGTYGTDLDLRAATTDQITISGTATVSGVVHVNLVDPLVAPGYALPGTHTPVILTAAGGVTHPDLTLQAFDTAVATYSLFYPDAQNIDLQYVIDYSPAGLTANQHAMGDVVNTIQTAQTSSTFRPIATNLFYLPDVPTLGTAYNSLSGEGVAAVEQVAFDDSEQFMTSVGNQVRDWMSDSPRAVGHEWRLWLSPYGTGAVHGGDAAIGSAKVRQSGYGIAGGLDGQVSDNFLIGFAGSGGTSWFNVPDRVTSGSIDSLHFGFYGAWHKESWYASSVVSYDLFENTEKRLAVIPGVILPSPLFVDGPYTVPGYNENPSGRFNAGSLSSRIEVGYRQDLGAVRVTPFVGLEFGSLRVDGFTETNGTHASVIGLDYAQHSTVTLPSLLGVQLDTTSELSGGEMLRAWVRATWKHEFNITRMTRASFISAPGFEFSVHGAQPARDAALADVGLKLDVDSMVAVYANFSGAFGGPSQNYAGTAGVSLRW